MVSQKFIEGINGKEERLLDVGLAISGFYLWGLNQEMKDFYVQFMLSIDLTKVESLKAMRLNLPILHHLTY